MGGRIRAVVVGGGASGLAAAICAARAGADVTVLEGASRVGQKILKTGNGRCNLTNARVEPADYRNGAAIMPLLEEFSPTRVLGFFGELGLLVSEEEEGRIYPLSNAANTVLDVLRAGCKWHAVDVRCGQKVVEIARMQPDGYRIICVNGNDFSADRVIIATGWRNGSARFLGTYDRAVLARALSPQDRYQAPQGAHGRAGPGACERLCGRRRD